LAFQEEGERQDDSPLAVVSELILRVFDGPIVTTSELVFTLCVVGSRVLILIVNCSAGRLDFCSGSTECPVAAAVAVLKLNLPEEPLMTEMV